ncbi:MAG: prepilin peptidase [Bacillota bacterium]|nr:prepilin peptidase [Bacillota bacterium]
MKPVFVILFAMAAGLLSIPITNTLVIKRGGEKLDIHQSLLILLLASATYILLPYQVVTVSELSILLLILICLSVTDIKTRKIPNILLLILLILKIAAFVFGFSNTTVLQSVFGLIAGLVIFLIPSFFGSGIGEGDVKFAAITGFFVGLYGLAISAIIMMAGLIIYAVILKILKKGGLHSKAPLGPFLAAGLFISFSPLLNNLIKF